MHQKQLTIATEARSTHDVTHQVDGVVAASGIRTGLAHVFLRHTSASLMLCENADPAVHRDLEAFMNERLVTDGDEIFTHRSEGADDMSAHVRTVLTHSDLTLPVSGGLLALGTWQGIYVWEHRYRGYERHLTVTVQGD
ncbi:MAG: secondary thiamine-phosphate synthase enzyme YjbQ [Halofilum sp. (in: g-proteobacteria)]